MTTPIGTRGRRGNGSSGRDKSFPYIALKSNSSDPEGDDVIVNADEQENDFNYLYKKSVREKRRLAVLSFITVLLTIINFSFIRQYLFAESPRLSAGTSETDLEFASAYIGFDEVYSVDPEAIRLNYTIENVPLVVGSVDQAHPTTSLPEEAPFWWTPYGSSIIPARRHLFVNETISTIVQFRALDFGLEICRPTLVLPTFRSLVNSTVRSDHRKPRTYNYSTPSVQVHVWALESLTRAGREWELDLAHLTYANRPQRKTYLGALDAREGVRSATDAFLCESASLNTLELSCDTPGCFVDVWTDDVKPKMAFFVEQSSSDS